MKAFTKLLFASVFIFAVFSCTSPIVFDDAYPKDVDGLSYIPEYYQGLYMCESDNTLIVINESSIYAESGYFIEASIEDILAREQCTIEDGEIYLSEIGECLPFEYISEDSVRVQLYDIDTLFRISDQAKMKPYKGSLVVSQQIENDDWIITLLSMDAYGNISYRAITEDFDLEEVESITDPKQISVDRNGEPIYQVKPTRSEFDAMFESKKIFIEYEYLIHMNPELLPLHIF